MRKEEFLAIIERVKRILFGTPAPLGHDIRKQFVANALAAREKQRAETAATAPAR